MLTRRADATAEQGVSWVSDGQGEYRVATVERAERGTTVRLKLKADADDFLRPERLKALIRKYSDHIAFPVRLAGGGASRRGGQQSQGAVGAAAHRNQRRRVRRVLQAYCSRQRRPADLEPQPRRRQARVHELAVRAGRGAVRSVESRSAERREALRAARLHHGTSDAVLAVVPAVHPRCRGFERACPKRLARTAQQDEAIGAMRTALTRRVLDMLDRWPRTPASTRHSGRNSDVVLKEGLVEDPANRDRIANLLRFSTTKTSGDEQSRSLKQYLADAKPEQQAVYYLIAETPTAARNNPHFDVALLERSSADCCAPPSASRRSSNRSLAAPASHRRDTASSCGTARRRSFSSC